jgi:hypothetical protein
MRAAVEAQGERPSEATIYDGGKGWKAKNERCGVKAERRYYTGEEGRRRPSSPSVHTKRIGPTRNEGATVKNESIHKTQEEQLKGGPKGGEGGGERTEGRRADRGVGADRSESTLSDTAEHSTALSRYVAAGTCRNARAVPRHPT